MFARLEARSTDPRGRPATALQAAPITDPLPLPHQQRILQTHCGDGLRDTPRSPAAFGRLNLAGCIRDQLTSRCAVETAFLYTLFEGETYVLVAAQ